MAQNDPISSSQHEEQHPTTGAATSASNARQSATPNKDTDKLANIPTDSPTTGPLTYPPANNVQTTPRPHPTIALRSLTKIYTIGGKVTVPALNNVSLEIRPGEFVAIMGPSGSGKSTFMNIVGCLDRPTSGEYWLLNKQVSRMTSDELATVRNQFIGFVFQNFNLLGRANALKNVMLPMVYAGIGKREQERRARKVLQLVGLGSRIYHKPPELSGGQQQRVAIARALVNGPALLLADEPTGALDSKTGVEIMGVLQALNDQGLTVIVVTHDLKVAQYASRQVTFLDGRIVRDEPILARRSAQEELAALEQAATAPVESTLSSTGATK
jgi:putative ABC transport system ATP-binding protein